MDAQNATPWIGLKSRIKNTRTRNRLRASPAYRRMKLFLKRICGRELWLRQEVSPVLFQHREWAVCTALLNHAKPIVYSFGIGGTIDFERLLIEEFDAEVHGFDPTPSVDAWLRTANAPPSFRFYPWAIAAIDETRWLYPRRRRNGAAVHGMYTCVREASVDTDGLSAVSKCLNTIMVELGHAKIDVLKMDIEGAEYEVLTDLIERRIRPSQILVEFHHRFDGIGKDHTLQVMNRLARAGYQIAFVSSSGREVTLAYGLPA
jgi:FkbM family methyltransferase